MSPCSSQPERDDMTALLKLVMYPLVPAYSCSTIDLVLVGYSAGSIAASCATVPPYHSVSASPGSHALPPPLTRLRRLLVSYPLGVLWALTALRPNTFTRGLEDVVKNAHSPISSSSKDQAQEVVTSTDSVLSIWSTQDQFTSQARYHAWSERLRGELATPDGAQSEAGRERWKGVEVDGDGAGHFWRSRHAKAQLLHAVRSWVEDDRIPSALPRRSFDHD